MTYVKKQSTTTRLKNMVIQVVICSIHITRVIESKVELQITNQQLRHMKKGSVITEFPDCFRSFQLRSGAYFLAVPSMLPLRFHLLLFPIFHKLPDSKNTYCYLLLLKLLSPLPFLYVLSVFCSFSE